MNADERRAKRDLQRSLRVARWGIVIAACTFVSGKTDRALLERQVARYQELVKKSEEGQVIT